MNLIFGVGIIVGSIVGLLHGAYLIRQDPSARGLYLGVWTLALWAAFGTYVVVLWAVGAVAFAAARAIGRGRRAEA